MGPRSLSVEGGGRAALFFYPHGIHRISGRWCLDVDIQYHPPSTFIFESLSWQTLSTDTCPGNITCDYAHSLCEKQVSQSMKLELM